MTLLCRHGDRMHLIVWVRSFWFLPELCSAISSCKSPVNAFLLVLDALLIFEAWFISSVGYLTGWSYFSKRCCPGSKDILAIGLLNISDCIFNVTTRIRPSPRGWVSTILPSDQWLIFWFSSSMRTICPFLTFSFTLAILAVDAIYVDILSYTAGIFLVASFHIAVIFLVGVSVKSSFSIEIYIFPVRKWFGFSTFKLFIIW